MLLFTFPFGSKPLNNFFLIFHYLSSQVHCHDLEHRKIKINLVKKIKTTTPPYVYLETELKYNYMVQIQYFSLIVKFK